MTIKNLHIYDFDGTLFRSPEKPAWWKERGWWGQVESLSPPCVPERPGSDWWVSSTVDSAKASTSDAETYAVLITGRLAGKFHARLFELLGQVGLRFAEVHLTSGGGTLPFKLKVIENLIHKLGIAKVEVWEDRSEHVGAFKSICEQFGIESEIHLVSAKDHPPACTQEAIAGRVAAAYTARTAATQILEKQFGRFKLKYLPQHAAYADPTGALLVEAEKKYVSAGIPIRDDIVVALYGRGASHASAVYHMGSSPPAIQVAPKAFEDANLIHTLIHELGHYYHDKVVPGGEHNPEVIHRYSWATRQRRTQEGGTLDVLNRRRLQLDKRYLELQDEINVRKPLPRKGQPFEWDPWVRGHQYHVKGRIVGKEDSRTVKVEILEAPEEYLAYQSVYRRGPGPLIVPEAIAVITYLGKDEAKEKELKQVEQARTEVYNEIQAVVKQHHDRYEVQLHDWVPTTYARKNQFEWFAEMVTTFVLGHLKPEPSEWLLSVVKTGEAPKELDDVAAAG